VIQFGCPVLDNPELHLQPKAISIYF
jgi:hypothetical protein